MTKVVVAAVVIAGLASIPKIAALQGPAARGRAPVVVPAIRHDTSPPLRAIPHAMAPAAQQELREQGPIRGRRRQNDRRLDTVVQNYPGTALMPLPSQSFDGVDNVNGVLPPDTNGDVGPNHYVQWVNLSFAIFSKGTPATPPELVYGPAPGNTVWTGFGGPCETRNDGDPVVMYDHLADRWFMSQLAIPNSFLGILFAPFYQCIAVSATPDPTGPYHRYQYSFNKLNDYPKFGLWPDGYYMTMNQFQAITLSWAGQGVVAFDRARMLSGQPASMVYFDLASVDMNLGGMLPSHLAGPAPPVGSPAYFAEIDDDAWGYSPDQLQLWQFHVDWTTPSSSTFTGPALLPTEPFDSDMCVYATCIPQPGTTATLDTLSDRLMYRLQYRNFGSHESLVVNHTVDVDGADHAGIRWYEIRSPRAAPVIYQQGTYAPDSDHRWLGSIAMDRLGNIALGFSVSGVTTSPSVRYTGRLATDPPGLMTQGEADLVVGAGSQSHASGRWGDYSLLALDPTDQCTFWYTQEYYVASSAFGWRTRVGSFAWPSCLPASNMPRVTVAATTAIAREAGLVSGAFTMTRTGDLAVAMDVHYAVSGTAAAGSDYVALPGTITLAPGEATATIAVTPLDDVLVEANETVGVTIDADPAYVVGTPGGATVTIVSDDVPPDLIVSATAAPAIAGADKAITVTDTTKNQGSGPSDASVTAFYLSVNTQLDAPDVLLGGRAVPSLAPGASDAGTASVTIPATTAVGTYYILAKADQTNAIVETQEGNNVKATAAVKIGPDLMVSTLTVSAVAGAGDPIVVTDTTSNTGGGDAAPSATAIYLSTNVALDAADVLLATRGVPGVAAGAASAASTSVIIPPATAGGLYYVLVQADQAKTVAETQEANNVKFSSVIKVGPDLIVSGLAVPPTSAAGAVVSVTDTTKNQGAGAAQPSSTVFYLSTNTLLDAPDVLLGNRGVGALAAGLSDAAQTSLQIPDGTAAGTFFILAKADGANQVAESIETNNVAFAVIRIGPDLVVSALSWSGTAVAGGSITVADTTKNLGAGAAGASTTRFYLSTNAVFDAGDVPLGSRDVATLPGVVSSAGTTACTLPAGWSAGTYYLIGVADAASAVAETSETNNTAVTVLRIS